MNEAHQVRQARVENKVPRGPKVILANPSGARQGNAVRRVQLVRKASTACPAKRVSLAPLVATVRMATQGAMAPAAEASMNSPSKPDSPAVNCSGLIRCVAPMVSQGCMDGKARTAVTVATARTAHPDATRLNWTSCPESTNRRAIRAERLRNIVEA